MGVVPPLTVSKALPKPDETQGLDRRIRLLFKNGTLSLALMTLILFACAAYF